MMITKSETSHSVYTLETEILIPAEPATVFAFFADAENLETLTPAWLHFRILTPEPIEMREGALIDYRLKLHGIPIEWKTEITSWNPPHRFVDNQIKGPYRLWRHEHIFIERNNGTLVQDRVDYSVIGGPLVHQLFVKRDLEQIFRFRHEQLLSHFRPE